ncbi:hypothetical protein ACWDO6_23195 [Streptomyces sp. NPDC003674]
MLAKWRQKYPLFTPLWQEAWSGLRSQNEGGNGNLKKSALDSIDNPQLRLPHGRVAQTLLNAVIIFVANLRAIRRFLRDQGIQARKASSQSATTPLGEPSDPPPARRLPTEQIESPPRECHTPAALRPLKTPHACATATNRRTGMSCFRR